MKKNLRTHELAERWNCSLSWLANQRSAGQGPKYLKLNSIVMYRLCDIEAYEDDHVVETLSA